MSTDHVSRMLVGALGVYTVPALKKAALTAFPSVSAMRGSGDGHKPNGHGGYTARRAPRGRGKGGGGGSGRPGRGEWQPAAINEPT